MPGDDIDVIVRFLKSIGVFLDIAGIILEVIAQEVVMVVDMG